MKIKYAELCFYFRVTLCDFDGRHFNFTSINNHIKLELLFALRIVNYKLFIFRHQCMLNDTGVRFHTQ